MEQKAVGLGNIETRLIYYPMNREIADIRLNVNTEFDNIYFYSFDGIKLNAWYVEPQKGKPTVIYCHGQGENISMWQGVAQSLADKGYGIMLLEYRGHGKSEGTPFESGLYIDLESAIDYLHKYTGTNNDNIILWGRSLGGAVVADVASRDTFKGVILESTFTNIRDAAEHLTGTGILESKTKFWTNISTNFVKCLPLTQTFETDKKIHKIKSPLLIACSVHDETIPCEMSIELSRLNPNADLFVAENGSHHSSEWIMPKVFSFIKVLSN